MYEGLKGPYFLRAKKAIEAGCDIVLHCEPNIQNIIKSTEGAGTISNQLKKNYMNKFFIINSNYLVYI